MMTHEKTQEEEVNMSEAMHEEEDSVLERSRETRFQD